MSDDRISGKVVSLRTVRLRARGGDTANAAMSPGAAFFVSATEMELLSCVGPLAFQSYIYLRSLMDTNTKLVGSRSHLSFFMISTYSEMHVFRGRGTQIVRPSTRQVESALRALQQRGLVRREQCRDLVLSLPKARV